ncbi:MAG: hypothetical protein ACE5OZ_11355 [Candidatus Heimdallarchaeota archaeon]
MLEWHISWNGFGDLSHQGIEIIKDCDGPHSVTNEERSFFLLGVNQFFQQNVPISMLFELPLNEFMWKGHETEAELRKYYDDLMGKDEYELAAGEKKAFQQGKAILTGIVINQNFGDYWGLTCYICYAGLGDWDHLSRQGIEVIQDCDGF